MSLKAVGLERFEVAQALSYRAVVDELQAGRKTSHWMWFVFPQLRQLGRSETAKLYGLADAAEARAYAMHPVLGQRLLECTGLVLATSGRTAHEIFGSPDDLKLCSSMTLFEHVWPMDGGADSPVRQDASGRALFSQVLDRFYAGKRDAATLSRLDVGVGDSGQRG